MEIHRDNNNGNIERTFKKVICNVSRLSMHYECGPFWFSKNNCP